MTLDEAIKRYADNSEYERTHGNLQGCLEFRQLCKWLKELRAYRKVKPCMDGTEWGEALDIAIKALEQESILDKIRAEIHATAEMHEDGDYYLRDEWIDEIIDKYTAESEDK